MAETTAPSLFGTTGPGPRARISAQGTEAKTLMELMHDGFYMLFLVRNRYLPGSSEDFRARIREFLLAFERGSQRLKAESEDVYLCKYAFCALVDELVLSSQLRIRDDWERRPLQLEYFGEQLAGDAFYERLDELRQKGAAKLQVLEVFHMCLLLGFQGRYMLDGSEKLAFLTARLGDEIAALKGQRAPFAPHWQAPDRVAHVLRSEVPLWAVASVIALAGLLAFLGLRWSLGKHTVSELAPYAGVVKFAPQVANVTITLP